jgi:hypothetical protein
MKSRRFTAQYLPCFRTKGIAHLGTAALRDFNPVYFSRITSRIDDLTKRPPGTDTIVGADKAECQRRLEEMEAFGKPTGRVRFTMTGVKRAERGTRS